MGFIWKNKLVFGGFSTLAISSVSLASGINATVTEGKDIEEGMKIEELEEKDLIRRVGLNCGEEIVDGKECSIARKGIKVEQGNKKEGSPLVFGEGNTGKIKVYKTKSENYAKNLRFSIEVGNVTLKKKRVDEKEPEVTLLSRFEGYEIKRDGENLYLSRKLTVDQGKIMVLGLPEDCVLPPDAKASKTCSIESNKVNDIGFEGKETASSDQSLDLTISKTGETTIFKGGYRFSFISKGNLTISGSSSVKANARTDFTLKNPNADKLTLEKAWGDGGELVKKVGMSCGDSECTIQNGSLIVKQGNKTLAKGSKNNSQPQGKIKIYREEGEYENGFKFVIEEGNIVLTGTSNPKGGISKLEEYETYEIKESGGTYQLNRKSEANTTLKGSLGLPNKCNFPGESGETTCKLSSQEFKNINFENKNSPLGDSGEVTLTISKSEVSNTFLFGYRFSFSTSNDVTISTDNVLKAQIPGDFAIQKKGGTNLTLKRIVSNDEEMIKKVGLSCDDSSKVCTIQSGKLLLRQENTTISNASKDTGVQTQGTLKLQRDSGGYSLGLKFSVENNDITVTYDNGKKKRKMGEYDTYEIKEFKGTYYLTRKTSFIDIKWSDLGLPGNCTKLPNLARQECGIYQENYDAINFKDKDKGQKVSVVPDNSIGEKKETILYLKKFDDANYPFGVKYSLEANEHGDVKVPLTSGNIILWKHAKVPFKVIKDSSNNNKLTLERNLDINGVAKQLGLKTDCDDAAGCTMGGTINFEDTQLGNRWAKDATVINPKNQKITYRMDGFTSSTKGTGVKFILKKKIKVGKPSIQTHSSFTGNESEMRDGIYEAEWRDHGSVHGLYLIRKGSVPYEG